MAFEDQAFLIPVEGFAEALSSAESRVLLEGFEIVLSPVGEGSFVPDKLRFISGVLRSPFDPFFALVSILLFYFHVLNLPPFLLLSFVLLVLLVLLHFSFFQFVISLIN